MAAQLNKKSLNHIALMRRHELRLNQGEFWKKLGITQSGGSRYETGRTIPKPVALLYGHIYGKEPLEKYSEVKAPSTSASNVKEKATMATAAKKPAKAPAKAPAKKPAKKGC